MTTEIKKCEKLWTLPSRLVLLERGNDLLLRVLLLRHVDSSSWFARRASTANVSLVPPGTAFGFCLRFRSEGQKPKFSNKSYLRFPGRVKAIISDTKLDGILKSGQYNNYQVKLWLKTSSELVGTYDLAGTFCRSCRYSSDNGNNFPVERLAVRLLPHVFKANSC